MKTHPLLQDDETRETFIFIKEVFKFWKIECVIDIYGSAKTNDPLKRVISDWNDGNLTFLVNVGSVAKQMRGKQRKRIKSFTRDTSMAIEHTYNDLIVFADIYLTVGSILSFLENLPSTILKLNLVNWDKVLAVLILLQYKMSFRNYFFGWKLMLESIALIQAIIAQNIMDICDELACQISDHLPDVETNIPKDIKMLFYIAGYITRKTCLAEEEIFNDTAFYYHAYESFERNGLWWFKSFTGYDCSVGFFSVL